MKKLFILPALLSFILFLSQCYYLTQGSVMLNYYSNTVDFETVLSDENTDDETEELLLHVIDIKKFAVDELGLNEGKNYTRYKEIERDYLVTLISACKSDSFEPYIWNFFPMGEFPYKGYFIERHANYQVNRLKMEGYDDIYVRKVTAFSTLGILEDPVFSFFAKFSIFRLANLIIHEQTHTTIFIQNEINFNENLADFIGYQGALQYIGKLYGTDSDEHNLITAYIQDKEVYREYLNKLYLELDELYSSDLDLEDKLEKKEEIIAQYKNQYENEYENMFRTNSFHGFTDMEVNNAYIMQYRTYTDNQDIFIKLFDSFDNILFNMINFLKQLNDIRNIEPYEFIENYLNENN